MSILPSVIVPGLVRAEHVHAPEVFDRSQAFHDHFLLRHPARTVGKIDRDDRRKQLWREPNREREREQKRIEHRFVQENVEGKNREHEQQRDLRQQIAEPPHAAFELCFRSAQPQALRNFSEARVFPVRRSRLCPNRSPHACRGKLAALGLSVIVGSTSVFSAGNVSPVSAASLTNSSRASSSRPSPGMIAPAESSATSPGTISASGTIASAPSRNTRAFVSTSARNFATASVALYSCQNPSTPLTRTIARIKVASVWSCKKSDTIAAPIKIRIIGLLNWAMKSASAPARR